VTASAPPRGRGTPSGFPLFLVAFLLSPLVLVAWFGSAALLRVTGWPRWRLAAVAVVAGAFIVWVQGGPVAALGAHFRGVSGLLSQFGAPMVHLPFPGAFLWPQIPLAVPAGVLAATVSRPGVTLDGPDQSAAIRARRREAADRRKARRLAARPRPMAAGGGPVLGVSLGGDLTPWQSGKFVVLPEYAAKLPRLVLGRPGQGKSVYLCREAFLAGAAHRQGIVLDGKGDADFAAAVVDAYEAGWLLTEPGSYPTVHLFPVEPLSIWEGSPAEVVNKLLGVWAWSLEAQYFKEACLIALRLACSQAGPPVRSMTDLITRLDEKALARTWSGDPIEAGLVKTITRNDKLGDIRMRVANLAAAAGGLLDGTRAIGDADLTVVSLPTMVNRGDSESIFRILMADLGHWTAARKGRRPAWVCVDEFGALDGGRDHAVDLVERGRSAGVPVVLSGQSYRSLGDEDQRDRLVSSADALVLFGSATPDELVRLAGTVLETEAVYAVEDGAWSGRASVTHRHRAKVDPNTVRQLGVGEAVIVSRGRAARLLVIPAPSPVASVHTPPELEVTRAPALEGPEPGGTGTPDPGGRGGGGELAGDRPAVGAAPTGEDRPRPAGAAPGNPAPGRGPADAVASRGARSAAGASRALRGPTGGPTAPLDPPPSSPARRHRPPGAGDEHAPPDDRDPGGGEAIERPGV
jgi:hypothetical protein